MFDSPVAITTVSLEDVTELGHAEIGMYAALFPTAVLCGVLICPQATPRHAPRPRNQASGIVEVRRMGVLILHSVAPKRVSENG